MKFEIFRFILGKVFSAPKIKKAGAYFLHGGWLFRKAAGI